MLFRMERFFAFPPLHFVTTDVALSLSVGKHSQTTINTDPRNLPDRNAAKEMHDRSDRCAYHHPPLLLSHRNDDIHDLNHCSSEENPRDS